MVAENCSFIGLNYYIPRLGADRAGGNYGEIPAVCEPQRRWAPKSEYEFCPDLWLTVKLQCGLNRLLFYSRCHNPLLPLFILMPSLSQIWLGKPFQTESCVLLTCPYYFLSTLLLSGTTRCSRLTVILPLSQPWNRPFLEGALFFLSGE